MEARGKLSGKIENIMNEIEIPTRTSVLRKKEFIVISDGKYIQTYKMSTINQNISLLSNFKTGDIVECEFDIKGYRNMKGVVFHNFEVFKINIINQTINN